MTICQRGISRKNGQREMRIKMLIRKAERNKPVLRRVYVRMT